MVRSQAADPIRHFVLATILAFLMPTFSLAQRDAKVPDADPEIERRALQMADGFEVNLFAADPLLAKPIQMSFDPAGRLWVACSEVYPHILPGQKANDKIIVLEDRDGDGKADKTTVFADGLLIPTGVEPGDGGAYVANSTELLHFADTDNDGKADRRRIILSGFGTEDTHHILHTLRWGPEGLLYFNQSIYIHSHIETPYGVRRLNGGGIWQFRPESQQLEVFLRGFINTWGHHFDRWGQSFVTDGANGEGITYGMPGAWYPTAPGAVRILHGLNPGSPKHCGLEIVSGRHFPDDWQGNLVTNDFRGHRVCRFVLREDGSCYSSQEKAELIKSNHPAFRPVDVKMGPDGALYIADWYNPIIQHGEVDFRDPRRDHTHGRIWRVTAKGRPLVSRPKLVKASTAELFNALKSPEDWTRHQAKRVLKERGNSITPELQQWVQNLDTKDAANEHHLLEALWMYQAIDTVEPALLKRLLHAKDHRVRAAATRVAYHWRSRLDAPIDLLAQRIVDDHAQVRLEAVRALGGLADVRVLPLALSVLDRPIDQWLEYALWLTVRELEPVWMPALSNGSLDLSRNPRHLVYALQAVESANTVSFLRKILDDGRLSPDRKQDILELIAANGNAADLQIVWRNVVDESNTAANNRLRLLKQLEQAARQRNARPAGDLTEVGMLLQSDDTRMRAQALRLIGLWRVETWRSTLADLASSAHADNAIRQAAFDALASYGDATSRGVIARLAQNAPGADTRRMALIALAGLDPTRAATVAADFLASRSAESDESALIAAFLAQKKGASLLASALTHRNIHPEVAKSGLRAVRTAGRNEPALVQALTQSGKLTEGKRTVTPADVQALVAEVVKSGAPERGEAIFRRTDLACLKCHAIAGAGGQVGPDLASIGASAPVDYLVESILLPNKAIKENYHSLIVTTRAGKIFTGIKVGERNDALVLRDAEDREFSIPTKDIEEKANGASLMPEGAADALTRSELVDLVRFLSELGKVGPYSVNKKRLVRRWQVLDPTRDAYTLLIRTRVGSAAEDHTSLSWLPAYSTVAGYLPREDLPRFEFKHLPATISCVRCQVEVTTPGALLMRLNMHDGITAWIDGMPIELAPETRINLTTGLHTVTFAVETGKRKLPLQCEFDDASGSKASFRVVGGK